MTKADEHFILFIIIRQSNLHLGSIWIHPVSGSSSYDLKGYKPPSLGIQLKLWILPPGGWRVDGAHIHIYSKTKQETLSMNILKLIHGQTCAPG